MKYKMIIVIQLLLIISLAQSVNADYERLVINEAKRQGVEPLIALAIATQESGLNPRKKRYEAGLYEREDKCKAPIDCTSLGIMQVIPVYHLDRCGLKHWSALMHPRVNVKCGLKYFKECEEKHSSLRMALTCYNGYGDKKGTYYKAIVKVIERLKDGRDSAT